MVDSLSLVYLPLAVGLGALHALEPGHSKTLMAAYLIGTKGTKRDAIALGLSAAATHSIIVIALAVTALWLGREAFTESVSHYLQIGSGSLVILLGLWMIWSRRSSLFAHHAHHHHAPDPIEIAGPLATGKLEIIETPAGERLQLKTLAAVENLQATVVITREGRFETIPLQQTDDPTLFISDVAPEEPHTFDAILTLQVGDRREANPFTMQEPAEHGHEHLSEDAHARATPPLCPQM